jgi:hypothetical protein
LNRGIFPITESHERTIMHANRIAKHLNPMGVGMTSPVAAEMPKSACAFCIIAFALDSWQQLVYRAACEMAFAANQPSPRERILAISLN